LPFIFWIGHMTSVALNSSVLYVIGFQISLH